MSDIHASIENSLHHFSSLHISSNQFIGQISDQIIRSRHSISQSNTGLAAINDTFNIGIKALSSDSGNVAEPFERWGYLVESSMPCVDDGFTT